MRAMEPSTASNAGLESALDEYERLWQRGGTPNIVEFLCERGWSDGSGSEELVEEIGSIDLYQRWRRRCRADDLLPEFPGAEDYARLLLANDRPPFGSWSTTERDARSAVNGSRPGSRSLTGSPGGSDGALTGKADARTNSRHGSHPTQRSAGLRVRCPHCCAQVELVADAELESIACESCGSEFSLVDDTAATQKARALTTVGHFELIERVGMGAFGTVWKARDTHLERTVALKIPRKGQFDVDQERAFVREARNAAQLSHPGIVPVHEVGRDADTLYIVSEFIRGVTLADRITAGVAPAREVAEICRGVAEALHHAHLRGVVHRDLKPGNIMLNEADEPQLMDFGLAKRHAEEVTMTLEGHVLGTPAYMSPEQARGDSSNADARSDVYSLGVILFQLLTGELPYRGNTRMLLHQVLHADPPSPRKLNPIVPRDLETITLKCLSKSPSGRYESAAQVAAELSRWLDGKPIKARPIGPVARLRRWSMRNPTIASLAAAVAVSLIGAASVSSVFAMRAVEREIEATDARKAVEQVAFRANIENAQRALRENDPLRARDLLLEVAGWETSRNYERFEWRHLMTLARRMLPHEFFGHVGVVSSLAYSADGETLLSAGKDGTIREWDLDDPSQSTVIYRYPSEYSRPRLSGLCISPLEGNSMVALSQRGDGGGPIARLLVDGDQEFLNDGDDVSRPAASIAFSSDGSRLFTASRSDRSIYQSSDGLLRRWDLSTRRVDVRASIPFRPAALATLRDGRIAVAGSSPPTEPQFWRSELSGHLAVFDEDLTEIVCETQLAAMQVQSLAASPSENLIAVGDWEKTCLVRFDGDSVITSIEELRQCGLMLSFSADGAILAGCGIDGTAWNYDTRERSVSQQLCVNEAGATSIALSPDGESVAIGDSRSIKVFPTKLPSVDRRLVAGEGAKLRMLSFSDDERLLAAAYSDGVWVWDLSDDKPLPGCPLPYLGATAVGFAPNSHRLFVGDGDKLVSVDLENGAKIVHKVFGGSSIYAIDLASTGDGVGAESLKILVGIRTKGYMPWRGSANFGECSAVLLSGESLQEVTRIEGLHGHIDNIRFSPDGNSFAAPLVNTTVIVVDSDTGETRRRLGANSGWVRGIEFFPGKNALISTGWDNGVKIWDLDTGEPRVLEGHKRYCFDIGISEDERSIASLGELGRLVFWDLQTDEAVEFEPKNKGFSYSLAFSPRGRYLATESADTIVVREADEDIKEFARKAAADLRRPAQALTGSN